MREHAPQIVVTIQGDVTVVELTDRKILDEVSISQIGAQLAALTQSPAPRMVIDFKNVAHMSSSALGMLINANGRIKSKNGQLRLANIKPQILEVFVITKLNKLFKILPTRTEALANFTAH